MMFDGLTSRWMSPFSWATSSADGDLRGDPRRPPCPSGPSRRMSVPSSVPSTQRVAM